MSEDCKHHTHTHTHTHTSLFMMGATSDDRDDGACNVGGNAPELSLPSLCPFSLSLSLTAYRHAFITA